MNLLNWISTGQSEMAALALVKHPFCSDYVRLGKGRVFVPHMALVRGSWIASSRNCCSCSVVDHLLHLLRSVTLHVVLMEKQNPRLASTGDLWRRENSHEYHDFVMATFLLAQEVRN